MSSACVFRDQDDTYRVDGWPYSVLPTNGAHWRPSNHDTEREVLWLVVGAPPEPANTLDMTPQDLAMLSPGGPKTLPPKGQFDG